jgi:hypothetical protein
MRVRSAAVFSPPVDPFMSVLERELLLLLLSCVAWAWCCLGMFLANLARRNKVVVPLADAVTGKYLEAGVSSDFWLCRMGLMMPPY